MVPSFLEGILKTALMVSIKQITMLPAVTDTMFQDKGGQFTRVISFSWELGTVFGNGKNQFQIVQSNIILLVPIVEVILNRKLFWQISTLFFDERLYLGIVCQIDCLHPTQRLGFHRTLEHIPFRWKLPNGLVLEIVLEKNHLTTLEVTRCGSTWVVVSDFNVITLRLLSLLAFHGISGFVLRFVNPLVHRIVHGIVNFVLNLTLRFVLQTVQPPLCICIHDHGKSHNQQ